VLLDFVRNWIVDYVTHFRMHDLRGGGQDLADVAGSAGAAPDAILVPTRRTTSPRRNERSAPADTLVVHKPDGARAGARPAALFALGMAQVRALRARSGRINNITIRA
jgi:hypothetical protein